MVHDDVKEGLQAEAIEQVVGDIEVLEALEISDSDSEVLDGFGCQAQFAESKLVELLHAAGVQLHCSGEFAGNTGPNRDFLRIFENEPLD